MSFWLTETKVAVVLKVKVAAAVIDNIIVFWIYNCVLW